MKPKLFWGYLWVLLLHGLGATTRTSRGHCDACEKTRVKSTPCKRTLQRLIGKMVRKERAGSNQLSCGFGDVSTPDFEAVFEELERWNDVLKDHKHELQRPRP
ncbi:hypothetical protein [Phaeobacter inhibens]|uniref:hypothetical protein n=1 Tax=Phaeobacter inhibens TaxID=221822 RepID=UPI0021A680ED|nr:hypothetical protein [Phaeobacter inhibens]UWR57079.1 hypothetical protein K4F89_01055 [Phaeobacter inhibens]